MQQRQVPVNHGVIVRRVESAIVVTGKEASVDRVPTGATGPATTGLAAIAQAEIVPKGDALGEALPADSAGEAVSEVVAWGGKTTRLRCLPTERCTT